MQQLDLMANFLSLIAVLAEIICCIILFNALIPRKELFKNQVLENFAEVTILFALSYFITRTFNGSLQPLLIILSYFFVIHLFYESKLLVELCISIITYILLITVDIFSAILIYSFLSLPLDEIKSDPFTFFLATAFSKTLFFLIIVLAKKVLSIKRFPELKYISKYHWFVYILQSIISMVSLLALIELTYRLREVPIVVIVATFGLLILNYAVLILLESSSKYGKSVHDNALYRQQLETEINNVKILMKSFESQAQCIHDHKQHLATIYQLIYDEKYDQTENFIKSIQGGIYVALYRIRTNHAIIDAILNQKFLQAENNNIVLDIRAGDLSAIQIPDSLLVTIISNPIDNAIEACSIVSVKKIVTIKIVIEEGILIFSVINPIAKPVKIINNQIETTKADKSIHGMGLKNVALALSKCNGDYEIICNENSFQFTALIRL